MFSWLLFDHDSAALVKLNIALAMILLNVLAIILVNVVGFKMHFHRSKPKKQ